MGIADSAYEALVDCLNSGILDDGWSIELMPSGHHRLTYRTYSVDLDEAKFFLGDDAVTGVVRCCLARDGKDWISYGRK